MFWRRPLAVPILVLFSGCASSAQRIPEAWLSVPAAAGIEADQLARVVADATPRISPAIGGGDLVRVANDDAGTRLFRGQKPLTPAYLAIESFDVSLDRREVVFSARRTTNFDVGLVSLDGSQVNWIPEDPADEVMPRWAPRGNKAAMILRNRGGDLIRTVHIPTAVHLLVDFPFGRVRNLAWDRPAERFAVAWETPDASQRVELMRYNGQERRIAMKPAVALPVSVAPFMTGLMLRPASATYNERIPIVIWVTPGEPNAWDDARGALLQTTRSAALIVDSPPDETLLAAIRQLPWADSAALFIVDPTATSRGLGGAVTIVADESVPGGYYRRSANLISVDPAVVKSFAARFIADRLKGTAPSGHR